MAALYMQTDGVAQEQSATPNNSVQYNYGDGDAIFYAMRVSSADIKGYSDEQTIFSMWRGSSTTTLTFMVRMLDDGIMHAGGYTNAGGGWDAVTPDLSVDPGIADNEVFWLGIEVWFTGGAVKTQFYYGAQADEPVWAVLGSEQSTASMLDMRDDATNWFVIGNNRYTSGPADEWNGRVYDYQMFAARFASIGAANLVMWFNPNDHLEGDGNGDDIVATTGETWSLAGSVSMIGSDATREAGGEWWTGGGGGGGGLPASELARHGDSLLKYLQEVEGMLSGTVVGALNEYNGVTSPPRKEYKEARDTAFGIHGH